MSAAKFRSVAECRSRGGFPRCTQSVEPDELRSPASIEVDDFDDGSQRGIARAEPAIEAQPLAREIHEFPRVHEQDDR